ncbi:MAG: DJ-1/PfpI family protein [Candidatus Peregrinibacteria bacterium]|nr:DJ-1/PfpI family protein [Candidatus Peregrinibacteria bacterium]MCB9807728.1 DJ-1/PfpI family protein [Candidatus Peribacteria bacterium]
MKALLIIAQDGYQDRELEGTATGLSDAGFEIILSSKEEGFCKGKLGGTQRSSIAMRDVQVQDYDRIAFIGGPGAGAYASDPDALKIANDAYRADMPLGAICIAPTILAKAHVLDGKRATVWDSGGEQAGILEQYGAMYTGESVTVDGKIVTGNGPDAAEEFGKTLAAL